jgi:hypothetical protein
VIACVVEQEVWMWMMRQVGAATFVTGCAALAAALGCGGGSAEPPPDAGVFPDAPPPGKGHPPPPPPPTKVTIKAFASSPQPFAGPLANATLVAVQSGTEWVALDGANGVYQAEVSGDSYAIAVGCADEFQSNVRVYYQGLSDTKELHVLGCPPPAPRTAHLSVEVTGIPSTDNTEVWVGDDPVSGPGGSPFELEVPVGLVDILAYSYVRDSAPKVPIKMFRVPGTLDLEAPQTFTIPLDTLGLPVEPHLLRLTNLDPEETASVHSSYATPHSQVQWPVLDTNFEHTATGNYGTIDARLRQPDDLSNLTVTAQHTVPDGRLYQRQVRFAMKTPVDVTQALPAAIEMAPPVFSRSGAPRGIWTIPLAPATQLDVVYVGTLSSSGMTANHDITSRTLEIFVRPGWAGGATLTKITTPDLRAVPGWTANMALGPGAIHWSLMRSDCNMSVDSVPVDGRLFLNSIVSGTIAP